MCAVCRKNPCDSRCPNAEEPRSIYTCEWCKDVISWCRGWDLAATSEDEDGDPAYTAGVLIGKRKSGRYIVADVINKRLAASDVRTIIKMTAQADNHRMESGASRPHRRKRHRLQTTAGQITAQSTAY